MPSYTMNMSKYFHCLSMPQSTQRAVNLKMCINNDGIMLYNSCQTIIKLELHLF